MYFLLTSQSEAGEVTLFHGSSTTVTLQMQAQFHPAVLLSLKASLPTAQKGKRKHRDIPLTLYCFGPEVICTLVQSNFSGGWEM